MGKLRFLAALWAAKLSKPLLRLTHHNGTDFPGALAVKLCPDFLKYIGKPKKVIAVTGTNGKTTVNNMICDILEMDGYKFVSNRAGSNILSGVCTALLSSATLFGKMPYDLAVLEIDERSARKIYKHLHPDLMVVTNLFRDSIMRNGHPAYIADVMTSAIPEDTLLVMNADDLLADSVSPQNKRVYFGIDKMESDVTECVNLINDLQICPVCHDRLVYDYRRYHHIGKAHCPSCGFRSPASDFLATKVDIPGKTMTVLERGEPHAYPLINDSIFNIYNMVAVIALLRQMDMPHEKIQRYLAQTAIVKTRYERIQTGKVHLTTLLAKEKNALAVTRNLDYLTQLPGDKEIIFMCNCLNDQKNWSENVSWMYDCDFEFLNRGNITRVVCTGPRYLDYALRLELAGFPKEKIFTTRREIDSPDLLAFHPGEEIYLLHGVDSWVEEKAVHAKICKLAQEAAK